MAVISLSPKQKPSKADAKTSRVIDFTAEAIQAIQPPTDVDRVEYKDSKEQGLFLRVTKTGVKTFSYFGRPKGASKPERRTLGRFPIVKPAEARRMARELSGLQATGVSVSADARVRRQEMTVADLWEKYQEYLTGKKRPEVAQHVWNQYIGPKFGKRRLSEVQYSEVERWHKELPKLIIAKRQAVIDEITASRAKLAAEKEAKRNVRKHGPLPSPGSRFLAPPAERPINGNTTANRCVEVMRAMYNWASHPKRALYSGINPAASHDMHSEIERSRFVQEDELGAFFRALMQMTNETARDAILTSLLAAARKSNILSMRWEDLSLTRREWSLPGEFQKNGQPYVVPLIPELAELLERRKAARDLEMQRNPPKTEQEVLATKFVFASPLSSSGHIVTIAKQWAALIEAAGIKDLRPHDLRRTMGSWQAKTGASLLVIGKSLNHKDHKATAIYARLDMDPVRESMTTAATAMFEAAGLKPKSNNTD